MFSPKDPAEIITLTFDFSAMESSLTSASCSCSVVSGTDPSAASMISGAAQITGAIVRQQIINGVSGVNYSIRCTAISASDGDKLVLADILPVMTF